MQAHVADRVNKGTGCPFCLGRKVCPCNSLAALHPELAAEWSPRNGAVLPDEVPVSSNRQAWWRRERLDGSLMEWQAYVYSRTQNAKAARQS